VPQNETPNPYQYNEDPNNLAHPATGLTFNQADVNTINAVVTGIAARRQELGEDNSHHEIFAGVTAGDEQGGHLLVVDLSQTTDSRREQYVVRTAPIAALKEGTIVLKEEPISEGSDQLITSRRGAQLETKALGTLDIDWLADPDPRFETVEDNKSVTGLYTHGDGGGRAVSLDNALKTATEEEWKKAASDALKLEKHVDRYPKIPVNTGYHGQLEPSPQQVNVANALKPIVKAIEFEHVDRAERVRLVNLGHTIMDIANRFPENNVKGMVLNPEEAMHIAQAEDKALAAKKAAETEAESRTRMQKLLKRGDEEPARKAREMSMAASLASNEYRQSLKNPQ
jgi:hypothetical protein